MTLKFGITSNFGKDGTLGYCLMAMYTSGAVHDMVLAPEESSEAMVCLKMSSDFEITAFLSWEFSYSAKHTNFSPLLGFHSSL